MARAKSRAGQLVGSSKQGLPQSLMQNHPLTEISSSPGHLLLLKLFHREEGLSALRVTALQTRLDTAKGDAFRLSTLFLAFNGLSLTLLFTASISTGDNPCRNWGVPSFLILLTSLVLVCAVQVKVTGYWRAVKKLVKEKEDARALVRCVQELRMKGASFDLSKEPVTGKRMKSSSVEVKWRLIELFKENMVTIFLLCFTGLVFSVWKYLLCG